MPSTLTWEVWNQTGDAQTLYSFSHIEAHSTEQAMMVMKKEWEREQYIYTLTHTHTHTLTHAHTHTHTHTQKHARTHTHTHTNTHPHPHSPRPPPPHTHTHTHTHPPPPPPHTWTKEYRFDGFGPKFPVEDNAGHFSSTHPWNSALDIYETRVPVASLQRRRRNRSGMQSLKEK